MDLIRKEPKKEGEHKFPYLYNLTDLPIATRGKVFSCFSGGGGSSIGYKIAGFDVVGFSEIDKKQAEIYQKNMKVKFPFVGNMRELLTAELPKELYNLDILDGSPPCSTFSLVGLRDKVWGKEKKFREGQELQILDTLYFDFAHLAGRLRPKILISENVPAMLTRQSIHYVTKVYEIMQEYGYTVGHYVLPMEKMGVPQIRKRLFIIAVRNDIIPNENTIFFKEKKYCNLNLRLQFNENPIVFGCFRSLHGADSTERAGQILKYRKKTDKWVSDIIKRVTGIRDRYTEGIVSDNQVSYAITATSPMWRMFDGKLLSVQDMITASTFPQDFDCINNSVSNVRYVVGMSVPPNSSCTNSRCDLGKIS